MDISPLSIQQIVAVIRQQMTTTVRLNAGATATAAPQKRQTKPSPRDSSQKDPAQHSLGQLVTQRIAAIQNGDPQRRRKAFHIFLETVLLNELGENLLNDAGFNQMVDIIQKQMENTPDTAELVQEATNLLLSGADPVSQRKST